MTEADWLTSAKPAPMLAFLVDKASDRKLRLFAVSLIRTYVGEQFPAEYNPHMARAELIADGLANVDPSSCYWIDCRPANEVADKAISQLGLERRPSILKKCRLLRELFGNPFRPVAVEPSWLTSTVVALAGQMYDGRDFSRMPLLADALMDAGCENDDVLNHCRLSHRREPVDHVRGCWVVDLLTGRK